MISRAILCGLLAAGALGSRAAAQTGNLEPRNRLVILVVPGLGPDTIDKVPALQELQKRSVTGWMNVRTARVSDEQQQTVEQREAASLLSLNAGTRAAAPRNAVHATSAELQIANDHLDHSVRIGLLGEVLKSAGKRILVISSDRILRLLVIDSNGRVPFEEDVSSGDPSAPFGVRDFDPSKEAYFNDAPWDVAVWGFGDLQRAESYAPLCLPEAADRHRQAAIDRLNSAVERLGRLAYNGYLMVLSPTPPGAWTSDHLAPILLAGPGIQKGWLTSPSTRRPGIVTNYDFLPTVCSLLGIRIPGDVIGRPMARANGFWTSLSWSQSYHRFSDRSHLQSVFGGLPTLQWISVLLGTFLLVSPGRLQKFKSWVRVPCGLVMALPLLLLILPGAGEDTLVGAAMVLLDIVVVIELSMWMVGKQTAVPIVFAPGLLIALIWLDLLFHGTLLENGLMSYSVMEGARYYGIGNEYGGALIGAILALACLIPRLNIAVILAVLLSAVLSGLPQYGANLGVMVGAVAAAAGVLAGMLPVRRKAIAVGGVLAIAAAIAGLLLLDSARGLESQSHLGRALSGGIVGIASRKLSLNLYLVLHSVWSPALLISSGAIWLIRRRFPNPDITPALYGLVAGATALFLFNDSGVVAAACCVLPVCAAVVMDCEGSRRLSNIGGEGGSDSNSRSPAATA